jgi:hypothetical protein
MKLRKLKKLKQEQQGWPITIKCKSWYGYGLWEASEHKFVHPITYITHWHNKEWRGIA